MSSEPRMAWQFQTMLNSIDAHHQGMEKLTRKGAIFRDSNGSRLFWQDKRPTQEEMDAAKAAVLPWMESSSVRCACCDTRYAMASYYESVLETGVCPGCLPFVEGRLDGMVMKRPPTLEEALEVNTNDLRQSEVWVIRDALVKMRGGRNG